eukprot:TRINITY_DN10882_c0_g1_i1.p1 TRINITY_DN10882_c0_g1~~TRINITY_DN10882_c0_g1_i1.p1  ORF type:complete len:360 (-),score=63.80 TRINITY_DN10882_c0_g1_i1:17-1096(-)
MHTPAVDIAQVDALLDSVNEILSNKPIQKSRKLSDILIHTTETDPIAKFKKSSSTGSVVTDSDIQREKYPKQRGMKGKGRRMRGSRRNTLVIPSDDVLSEVNHLVDGGVFDYDVVLERIGIQWDRIVGFDVKVLGKEGRHVADVLFDGIQEGDDGMQRDGHIQFSMMEVAVGRPTRKKSVHMLFDVKGSSEGVNEDFKLKDILEESKKDIPAMMEDKEVIERVKGDDQVDPFDITGFERVDALKRKTYVPLMEQPFIFDLEKYESSMSNHIGTVLSVRPMTYIKRNSHRATIENMIQTMKHQPTIKCQLCNITILSNPCRISTYTFHEEHYNCSSCSKSLTNTHEVSEVNGILFCKECK